MRRFPTLSSRLPGLGGLVLLHAASGVACAQETKRASLTIRADESDEGSLEPVTTSGLHLEVILPSESRRSTSPGCGSSWTSAPASGR